MVVRKTAMQRPFLYEIALVVVSAVLQSVDSQHNVARLVHEVFGCEMTAVESSHSKFSRWYKMPCFSRVFCCRFEADDVVTTFFRASAFSGQWTPTHNGTHNFVHWWGLGSNTETMASTLSVSLAMSSGWRYWGSLLSVKTTLPLKLCARSCPQRTKWEDVFFWATTTLPELAVGVLCRNRNRSSHFSTNSRTTKLTSQSHIWGRHKLWTACCYHLLEESLRVENLTLDSHMSSDLGPTHAKFNRAKNAAFGRELVLVVSLCKKISSIIHSKKMWNLFPPATLLSFHLLQKKNFAGVFSWRFEEWKRTETEVRHYHFLVNKSTIKLPSKFISLDSSSFKFVNSFLEWEGFRIDIRNPRITANMPKVMNRRDDTNCTNNQKNNCAASCQRYERHNPFVNDQRIYDQFS